MKKDVQVTFLCELPPPYGGVTIKNQLINDIILKNNFEVEIIDFFDCKRSIKNVPIVFIKMIKAFVKKRKIIYGFGSYRRLRIAVFLQNIFGGKSSLQNTINFVMGGILQEYIKKHRGFAKRLNLIKVNYVESRQMIQMMENIGVNNAKFFPNARSEHGSREPKENDTGMLKCVFFSQISTQKGIRCIMDMYQKLPEEEREKITIDFYGHVLDEIRIDFETFEKQYDNISYRGVFDAVQGDVYEKLNEFDVLLFPTLWFTEGVPGVLVEAKMAGICPIVSNRSYNCEIVKDGVEGIVIYDNYEKEMAKKLKMLIDKPEVLMRLKEGAFLSRKRYAIERYTDDLKSTISQ